MFRLAIGGSMGSSRLSPGGTFEFSPGSSIGLEYHSPKVVVTGSSPVWGRRYFPGVATGVAGVSTAISPVESANLFGGAIKATGGYCGRPVRLPECSSAW